MGVMFGAELCKRIKESVSPTKDIRIWFLMEMFCLAVVLLLALALRLQSIDSESAWCDEVVSLEHLDASGPLAFVQQERADDPPMVPLYFLLQYGWTRVFGTELVTVRGLSVLLGLASLVLTYLLGRFLFGAFAGLTAAALMALSGTHIYYSQEVRPYALVLVLTTLSAHSLVRALAGGRKGWWCVNVAANICLMWTHLFAVLFLAAEGLCLCAVLWRRRDTWTLMLWLAAHAPSSIAWGLWFQSIDYAALDRASPTKRFIAHSFSMLVNSFMRLCGDRPFGFDPRYIIPGVSFGMAMALTMGFLSAWAVLRLALSASPRRGERRAHLLFLVVWMVLPAVILYSYSLLLYPSFFFRYIYFSSVPIFLLAGAALSMMRNRPMRAAVLAGLIALYGTALSQYPHPWRMQWNTAAGEIRKYGGPNDRIAVYGESSRAPLAYACGLGQERVELIPNKRGLVSRCAELAAAGHTVWMVVLQNAPGKAGWLPNGQTLDESGLKYARRSFTVNRSTLRLFRVFPARQEAE